MKNFAIKLAWFTSIYVVAFVGICQTKLSLFPPVVISMYLFGVCLVLFLVITVLHDEEYKTNKKFKDWYRDHPK